MFKWIGPNAKPVVPVLQEMLKLPERQEPQEFEDLHAWQLAVEALLSIGETNLAVSDAMQKLKSKDTLTRVYATEFLNSAQPTNAAAIASLIEFLRDPTNRHWAVEDLGECGAAAKAAVPILREITSNRTNELRHAAMQVLEDIEAAVAEERDAR